MRIAPQVARTSSTLTQRRGEGCPVGLRGDADETAEVGAQGDRGAEADEASDVVDGQGGGFQQVLRVEHALGDLDRTRFGGHMD
jgi:hypothetical protein